MAFDHQTWEQSIYQQNKQLNQYPYDSVVSYIHQFKPQKNHSAISILELGCGAGNNLWFAAREGFNVIGVDGSQTAINYAKDRFHADKLSGEFIVSDYLNFDYPNSAIDMMIDRAALCCCSFDECKEIIQLSYHWLKPGGSLYFNPYSKKHTAFINSQPVADSSKKEVTQGLVDVGHICFYDEEMIRNIFPHNQWTIKKFESVEHIDLLTQTPSLSSYVLIARKR